MNKNIVEEFYLLTLIDLRDGISIDELEEVLKLYEEVEDYEACAGILKAINETRYDTLQTIKQKINEQTNRT